VTFDGKPLDGIFGIHNARQEILLMSAQRFGKLQPMAESKPAASDLKTLEATG
jgi:hypothetical protein